MPPRLRRAHVQAWGRSGTAPVLHPAPGSDGPLPKPALEAAALLYLARESADVFSSCVVLALSSTRATTALALLHRPELGALEVVAAAGRRAGEALGRCVRPGEALAWRVLDSGSTCLIPDAQQQADALFVAGAPRPGAYLGVPLSDPEGRVFGVLSVDTTDSSETLDASDVQALTLLAQAAGVAYARLSALEAAQQSAARFRRLAELSADLGQRHDPDDIARHAQDTLLSLCNFTTGAVFRLEGGHMRVQVLAGRLGDEASAGLAPWWPQIEPLLWRVVQQRQAVHLGHDDPWWQQLGVPVVPLAVLAAPLCAQGQVVGVIGMATSGRRSLAPEAAPMLQMVAARMDRALERAHHVERLRQLRESALRGLGRVLERRDDETFGHTDRVTALAERLGEALGLDPEELRHLRWGAYLHDIGKVAVPDAILRKPGPLTPQERAVMQTHVVTGEEILLSDEFMPAAVAELVRHHHERWDGGGYPDGLRGEAIPLLARIFSVVDVYDALVSERPYKRAWTPEEACAELARCAGSQFDPRVVEVFLTLLNAVERA